ncbi:FAD-dependent oxidoreductase [Paenibacillus sp. LjRoot56]|uniref:FAD-dependent oxidoreductase n=1 Tax=Paenibacillus sp. LjRoot56 TaxID=3342333 RepID=UPI003F4F97FD
MRIQATCYALGQAAGVAAWIAIDCKCKLRDVPMEKLHEELTKQGVHFVRIPKEA